jgi:hypothetical protein
MTINELIEQLEEARTMFAAGGETEVMLATQQNYPLRSHLAGVAVLGDGNEDEDEQFSEDDTSVCWLLEGSQHYERPYAPRSAWEYRL